MPDILPCGHPAAAWIDHPGWGWCAQCAQQAEAALPPVRPSRLVPTKKGEGGREKCDVKSPSPFPLHTSPFLPMEET